MAVAGTVSRKHCPSYNGSVSENEKPNPSRRRAPSTQTKIEALLTRSRALYGMDSEKAQALAVQAQQLSETYEYKPGLIDSILLQAGCLSDMLQYAEAMALALRAMQLSRVIGSDFLTAKCHAFICVQFRSLGDYANALLHARRMLTICEAGADHAGVGTAGCLIGMIYEFQGDFSAARREFDAALALAEINAIPELEIRANLAIGGFLDVNHDRPGAIRALLRCIQLCKASADRPTRWQWQTNRSLIALTQSDLGAAYINSGQLAKARECLSESFAYFRASRNLRLQCFLLINLSDVAFQEGDAEPAYRLAKRALARVRRTGDVRLEIYAQEAIGKALCLSGKREQGHEALTLSLKLAQNSGAHELLPQLNLTLSQWPPLTRAVPKRRTPGAKSKK